jgi:hypothetical protein
VIFSPKIVSFLDYVKKYGRARQVTDDNIIWRMYVSSSVTKAADRHSEYVIFLLFHGNNDYSKAPQQCVIRRIYRGVSL